LWKGFLDELSAELDFHLNAHDTPLETRICAKAALGRSRGEDSAASRRKMDSSQSPSHPVLSCQNADLPDGQIFIARFIQNSNEFLFDMHSGKIREQ
jgi:hypothetical protein